MMHVGLLFSMAYIHYHIFTTIYSFSRRVDLVDYQIAFNLRETGCSSQRSLLLMQEPMFVGQEIALVLQKQERKLLLTVSYHLCIKFGLSVYIKKLKVHIP